MNGYKGSFISCESVLIPWAQARRALPLGPGPGPEPQHKHVGKEFLSTFTLSLASLSLACRQQATDDYLELGSCVKIALFPPHPQLKSI